MPQTTLIKTIVFGSSTSVLIINKTKFNHLELVPAVVGGCQVDIEDLDSFQRLDPDHSEIDGDRCRI